MTGDDMMQLAMRVREAKGLHVRITGKDMPLEGFNAYAKDIEQRDRWVASYTAKGYTIEVVKG